MGNIMYDEMASDIFEQQQPKKKVRNLYDVGQYKEDEYRGEDETDIDYRTRNASEKDLVPPEYETYKIGKELPYARDHVFGINQIGTFNKMFGIGIVEDKFFEEDQKRVPRIIPIDSTKEGVLRHEYAHEKEDTADFEHTMHKYRSNLDLYTENPYGSVVGYADNPDYMTKKAMVTEFDNQFEKKFNKRIGNRGEQYLEENPKELFATYSELFPEQILNPTNKLAKKVTRTWFL